MRDIRVSLFLTKRMFIRGNKGVLITPVIVMAVIYINLLFVPALIQGAVNQNHDQLTDHLFSNFLVTASGSSSDLPFSAADQASVIHVPGVEGVTSSYEAGYQIFKDDKDTTSGKWTVQAIDPSSYYTVFSDKVASGSRLTLQEDTGIVLGSFVAGNGHEASPAFKSTLRGVNIGEEVSVKMANGSMQRFTTRGIFNDNYYAADSRAFISRQALEKIIPHAKDRAMTVYIKTDPSANQEVIRQQLAAILPGTTIRDTQELSGTLQDTVGTIQTINRVISSLSLLVGAITIFIVTYVDLITRRKQIGIERAVGIRNETIVMTYVLRAVICTIVGIVLGGLLFRFGLIPYFEHRPFNFPGGQVSLVFLPTSFVSYLATLMGVAVIAATLPAIRSIRVKILDAIWS